MADDWRFWVLSWVPGTFPCGICVSVSTKSNGLIESSCSNAADLKGVPVADRCVQRWLVEQTGAWAGPMIWPGTSYVEG